MGSGRDGCTVKYFIDTDSWMIPYYAMINLAKQQIAAAVTLAIALAILWSRNDCLVDSWYRLLFGRSRLDEFPELDTRMARKKLSKQDKKRAEAEQAEALRIEMEKQRYTPYAIPAIWYPSIDEISIACSDKNSAN